VAVVGEVVKLREKLAWQEKKPLFGRRVLVTRAREDAGRLTALVAAQGGEAVEFPAIAVEPVSDYQALDQAVRQLGSYQWVVFTSANGVRFFWERLWALGRDARALAGVKVAAIGPRTAEALGRLGLRVDLVPQEFRAEAVLAALLKRTAPGERVLCPRAQGAREVLVRGLAESGRHVDEVATYRTVAGKGDPGELRERLGRGEIDAVTFTSSSTVHSLVRTLGEEAQRLLAGTVLAAIGPVTARTLADYGLACPVTASRYTVEGLVEALTDYFSRLGRVKNP